MTSLRDLTPEQKQIAKDNGIVYHTLSSRLLSGWDIETAITKPTLKYMDGMHYKGKYVTQEQRKHAMSIGVDKALLQCRLENGWTVEEAVNRPVRKYTKKEKRTDFDEQEVLEVVGRIKYHNSINSQAPMAYPKRMINRLEKMGYKIEDVKALEF